MTSKNTSWSTEDRFNTDSRLLKHASIANQLVKEHQLNDQRLKNGLQKFVDAVGQEAEASADVILIITEGERLKAQDNKELNQVEHEDRQSLLQDMRINTEVNHMIREQENRGAFNEAKTLELANISHEMANDLTITALELQRLKTEEQKTNIQTEISRTMGEKKAKSQESIREQLRNRKGLTYNKVIGSSGEIVDVRLNTPSALIKSLEPVEE